MTVSPSTKKRVASLVSKGRVRLSLCDPPSPCPVITRGANLRTKERDIRAEILTPEEVRSLFGQISITSSIGLRNRAVITVLYRAGLRHAEALALLEKDVDLSGGAIAVLHGKGDRRRTVGIDPGACEVIRLWIERRRRLGFGPEVPLFCTLQGRPMKQSYMKHLLPRLAQQARIGKRVHAHGLRHTHAYELMMEGVEIPIIQRQLGHVSLATTSVYLNHIAPRQVIETMRNAIGRRDHFGGSVPTFRLASDSEAQLCSQLPGSGKEGHEDTDHGVHQLG